MMRGIYSIILAMMAFSFSVQSIAQTDLIFKNGMEAGVELFSIVIENTSNNALSDIPITIGQPFKKGDVQTTDYFQAIINHDENNAISTIQFNP
ncbi:MAG TPA: hypothetical protein ENJ41_01455, partial [Oceanospirillales bacterium]|nr:hypothetical protein [Oceanospirillales bacterium]